MPREDVSVLGLVGLDGSSPIALSWSFLQRGLAMIDGLIFIVTIFLIGACIVLITRGALDEK